MYQTKKKSQKQKRVKCASIILYLALCFKNFRCDHGKQATIRVYGHKAIGHDKEIGHASYPLPVRFNELQNDTLELKNNKDHLHGILTVHTMVKKN